MKDERDIQGRWKGKQHVLDVYDDFELPFPDAKVTGCLCMGGPCKYKVREDSGITNNFILQYVTPNIRRRLGDCVALILGAAILFYAYSPEGQEDVPPTILQRVCNAYNNIRILPVEVNTVSRIPLHITGHEGEVYMDPLPIFQPNNNGNDGGGNGGNGNGGGGNNNNNNGEIKMEMGIIIMEWLKMAVGIIIMVTMVVL